MTKATVAYENAREAKRKLKAVRPLRWHRMGAEGRYEAKGERGRYVLMSRSPNRRKGVFPWTVLSGGLRGPEIKTGGFDLKSDAQTFAAQYDAGLCGAPAIVVQAPSPQGLPPGVYRGTAAEAKRTPYFDSVEKALRVMDAGGLGSESSSYVSQMEAAGVDPTITASVLVATHGHRHDHNCAGKHVELAEAGAGAAEGRRESHIFRGKRFDLFRTEGSWWYQLMDGTGYGQGGFPSREAAMAGAQRALGMPAGFSVAVEGAAEARRRSAGPKKPGERTWSVAYTDEFGVGRVEYADAVSGTEAAKIVKREAEIHGHPMSPKHTIRWHPIVEKIAPDEWMIPREGAEEAKKRLWQPDPSTGIYITHSSLTRDSWVLRGDRVLGKFPTRGEAEAFARDLVEKKA